MEQSALWDDTIFDALGSAVKAAGGAKRVAGKLWPTLDQTTASSRLRGCLNPEHAQKLCPAELLALGALAKEAGDTSIMDFFAREWGFDVKPLTPADAKKRARLAREIALLDELKRLRLEDDE